VAGVVFHLFVHEGKRQREIARILNHEQIKTDLAAYFTAKAEAGAFRVEPALAARFFLGILFSYVVGRKLWNSAVPDRATLDGIVDIFLNGVRS